MNYYTIIICKELKEPYISLITHIILMTMLYMTSLIIMNTYIFAERISNWQIIMQQVRCMCMCMCAQNSRFVDTWFET